MDSRDTVWQRDGLQRGAIPESTFPYLSNRIRFPLILHACGHNHLAAVGNIVLVSVGYRGGMITAVYVRIDTVYLRRITPRGDCLCQKQTKGQKSSHKCKVYGIIPVMNNQL